MTIHLLKTAAGVKSIEALAEKQQNRIKQMGLPDEGHVYAYTSRTPRRLDELIESEDGSVYWIIKRAIRCRQVVTGVTEVENPEGKDYILLHLKPEIILTQPRRKKPVQGWRYLEPADAPDDLYENQEDADLPPEMIQDLSELGIL
jgi:hypothetical protein